VAANVEAASIAARRADRRSTFDQLVTEGRDYSSEGWCDQQPGYGRPDLLHRSIEALQLAHGLCDMVVVGGVAADETQVKLSKLKPDFVCGALVSPNWSTRVDVCALPFGLLRLNPDIEAGRRLRPRLMQRGVVGRQKSLRPDQINFLPSYSS
jgi:hypothetical protein